MNQNQERALRAEILVQQRLEARGYRLLHHRWKTPFAEVDLVMANLCELLVVEVKCLSRFSPREFRVSPKQKQRLFRVRQALEARHQTDTRLLLALVEDSGELSFFHLADGVQDESLSFSLRKSSRQRL